MILGKWLQFHASDEAATSRAAIGALVETNRQLQEQNRRLSDTLVGVLAQNQAAQLAQYELGRLQLQPPPPAAAPGAPAGPQPGVPLTTDGE